jgi:hypothetical protein
MQSTVPKKRKQRANTETAAAGQDPFGSIIGPSIH